MLRGPYATALLLVAALLSPCQAQAQSEEIPLGDLARTLRKNQPPPRAVIDNDNLATVMEEGENKRWASTSPRLSFDPAAIQIVRTLSPDVSCALSFSGQKDPLDESLRPHNLPDSELAKLDGPATIVGNSLQLSIHNGGTWDVREITVGFTLVHRPEEVTALDGLKLLPAAINNPLSLEKHSDVTMLYHMKGLAGPSTTTLFQTPLNLPIGSDEEWHWAIVGAKGIPPAPPPEPLENQSPVIQAPK